MTIAFDECPFCRIACSDREQVPCYDTPIVETAEFLVVAALGQFIDGYVLICPKLHTVNLGLMPPDVMTRFVALKDRVRAALAEEYGRRPAFFEHGAVGRRQLAGSCIDHAHLHAIPLEIAQPPPFMSDRLKGHRVTDFGDVASYANVGEAYFLFECSGGDTYVYEAPLLPCQYGRQVFARLLALNGQWDWRSFPFYDRMTATAERLRIRMETDNVENPSVLGATC